MRLIKLLPFAFAPLAMNVQAVTHVSIQLDWIFNAQFAGLYQAIEQGYFAEQDLEVTLLGAPKSIGVVESVIEADDIRFGSSESSVLLAAGQPLVALSPMFQFSPMGWMYLPGSGIHSLADIKGKRIGIHADGEKILGIALARNGLSLKDITFVEVGYDPQVLIDGTVDLMQAYYIDEFVALQQNTGNKGEILLAGKNGYLAYSQVLFTSEKVLNTNRDTVIAVVNACRQGWAYALAHQEETIDLILNKWNPKLARDYQLESLSKMEALVRPDGMTIMPWASSEKWKEIQSQLLEFDLLPEAVNLEKFVFNPNE